MVDQSRRTIVGSGTVLVARKPFEVYAWIDRGYYRMGDTVAANFQARRPDGKPVQGPASSACSPSPTTHKASRWRPKSVHGS